MWHSESKCWRIVASVKANCKRLKATLALEVGKLGPLFLALKLDEFPLFDNFFLDLAGFWDLNNFLPFKFFNLANFFNFFDFLACSILSPPNLSSLLLLLFFSKAGLLLLFLLEINLLSLFLLGAGLLGDPIVFNIKISRIAILLKLWMNCW